MGCLKAELWHLELKVAISSSWKLLTIIFKPHLSMSLYVSMEAQHYLWELISLNTVSSVCKSLYNINMRDDWVLWLFASVLLCSCWSAQKQKQNRFCFALFHFCLLVLFKMLKVLWVVARALLCGCWSVLFLFYVSFRFVARTWC